MDGWMENKNIKNQMDGCKDRKTRWMVGRIEKLDGWLDGYKKIDGWLDEQTNGWLNGYKKQIDGWMERKKRMMVGWI